MQIRLLGPVEAWSDGARLDLGPRQQRFILAVLALEVDRLVSVDRLVDLTWPAAPPRTARHAIQVSVSRLRAALAGARGGAARLVTQGRGYVLRGDPLSIDAHEFRALAGQARRCAPDAGKVSLLRRALGLWRGPALADAGAPEAADQLTRGLTEDRIVVEEECLDAELRIGNHLAVLGELVDLVARHRYRQRFAAQLMIAQYRAGRPAEALATYRSTRAALVGDLGLDPERRLQELACAIVRGDPRLLDPPSALPSAAGASR
jgi:ABC-2 type transport system ATP-binding protein